jgi:pyruvate-ferredoxin/flavodoxin oxidoreductase
MPKTPRRITVLDRTKEPGALGDPLYMDICTATWKRAEMPKILGGRYGLGSKEFNPGMVKAVFDNMAAGIAQEPFHRGHHRRCHHTSLRSKRVSTWPPKALSPASSGVWAPTVRWAPTRAPSRSSATTPTCMPRPIFPTTPKNPAASPSPTCASARSRSQSTYLIDAADYIACHNPAYVQIYDVLEGIKDGRHLRAQLPWSPGRYGEKLPAAMRRTIAKKKLKFYTIDAVKIAGQVGLGGRINMIMQTAFFKAGQRDPGG